MKKVKSEQTVVSNPCLEEEEEDGSYRCNKYDDIVTNLDFKDCACHNVVLHISIKLIF
jgi:hypothetical protein